MVVAGQHPSRGVLETWRALLGYVRRATADLDAELRDQAAMGLEDYDVVYQLSQGPPEGMRMSALAGSLLVAASSCTRLIGHLVDVGWVERRPDPGDGRAVVVALTAPGRHALSRASVVHVQGIGRVFSSRLEVPQLDALNEALERLEAGPSP